MVEGICHCGAIKLRIDAAPDKVTDCNCSICRRHGTLWAYYNPKQARITEAVPTQTPDHPRMGINMRLFAPDVLVAARVHHFDGASVGNYPH